MSAILETPAGWMIVVFFIGMAVVIAGSVRASRNRGNAEKPWLRNKSTPPRP